MNAEEEIKRRVNLWTNEVQQITGQIYTLQRQLSLARYQLAYQIDLLLALNKPSDNPAEACTAASACDQGTSPTTFARPSDHDQGTLQGEF